MCKSNYDHHDSLPLRKIETDQALTAIGPYSQAVIAGDLVFVSGQIPIDPSTGKMAGEDIVTQTNQVINNIEAILATQNIGLERVVKTEVYLKDMNDFKVMNEVYSERFIHDPKPARQAMEVSRLPLDVKVEISCIAYTGKPS